MFSKRKHHPAEPDTYAVCFDPGTIGLILSVAGSIRQGIVAKQQSDLQAGVLRQQADHARLVAASDEEDFRRQQSRLMAKRRAALGASGIEASSGSPLLVSEDIAGETELGALRIRAGGEVSATRLEQQAGLLRFAGRAARTQGFIRGGSLLLTGAGKHFGAKKPALSGGGRP